MPSAGQKVMSKQFTAAELLARSHRRRRWIVRITLGSLLVLLLLALAALALTSSSMSIEEAEAIFMRLQSEKISTSDAELLLGKPLRFPRLAGKAWAFTKSSFNEIEVLIVVAGWKDANEGTWYSVGKETLTGSDAWKYRWQLLKWRLGFIPEFLQ